MFLKQLLMNLMTLFIWYTREKHAATPPRNTLVIRPSASYCGNCGFSSGGTRCSSCGTQWLFIATNYTIGDETLPEMGKRLARNTKRRPFIGLVGLECDGIGRYSTDRPRCFVAIV